MKRLSLRHVFIKIPNLCYRFAWQPADYVSPIDAFGVLTDETALNSDDYASDPMNEIAQYRIKELLQIYNDSQANRRRRNMSYTAGPMAFEDTGPEQFDFPWSIWSPPNVAGGVKMAKDPYSTVFDYATEYPAYAGIINGYKAILSATFDLSATPVLAWESAANQISVLRVVEGLTTFEGYSPIMFCNSAYVSNPEVQTDAVVFYLKDINGYSGIWNYNTLFNPADQFPDTRRGTAIYFRVQRDNFGIEYKMCDLGFQVQYLDNVTFSGNPNNPLEGDTFKQALSMVDGLCNRYTALSGQYFVPQPPDPHVPASASDSTSVTIDVSGVLFDIVMEESAMDAFSVTSEISGALVDAVILRSTSDSASVGSEISGVLFDTVVARSADDSASVASDISGATESVITPAPNQTDSSEISCEISGGLETV